MIEAETLELLSGPEDGTVFPLVDDVVTIGSDEDTTIPLRLDSRVRGCHARLTGTPEGFVVRGVDGGSLLVNGRRASIFRSQLLRPGEILKVGESELFFHSPPGAQEYRTMRPAVLESDFAHGLRFAGAATKNGLTMVLRPIRAVLRPTLRPMILLPIGFIIAIYAAMNLYGGQIRQIAAITQFFRHHIQTLLGQIQ